MIRILSLSLVLAFAAQAASAASCVNRFVNRSERSQQVVTLLTGKLTFQEAQALSSAISSRKAAPLEWVGSDGKTVAKQFGELKIIRPMPVGCDGKKSGVVMIVTFANPVPPAKKMIVKLDPDTPVTFENQE